MTTIATLAVRLEADAGNFKKTLENTEKNVGTWATNVSAKLKNVGADISAAGRAATTYLTAPLLAAGGAAVKMASDYEETKNKSNVVFGSMANDVLKWSENSDKALGMSKANSLDAVSMFGAMGQSAGLSAQDNANWAKSMVQLGSDWSSFYNLNPAEAMGKIQSAVAGQYEPLRSLGIVIDETAVQQKAMNMGLMEEGGALSDSARYQAIYALMVEKSAAAQGDFARTSDSAANQARIVRAQFENAALTIGQQLLPYATKLLQWVSQAIAWFQKLTPEQQKWIVIILAVVAAVGPLLVVIGTLISAIGAIMGVIGAISAPVLIVIAVIAALIAIGYLLYRAWTENWGGIQEKMAAVWAWLQPILQNIWNWLSVNIPLALQTLAGFWTGTLLPAIQAVWGFLSGTVFPFWQALANFMGAVFGVAITALAGLWQNVLQPAFQDAATAVSSKLQPVFQALVDFWNNTLLPIVQKVGSWIGEKLAGAFDGLKSAIKGVTDFLNDMTDVLNNIELPEALTPGSPTPFEIGLWGIHKALRAVSGMSLPTLSYAMADVRMPEVGGSAIRRFSRAEQGSGNGIVLNNYGTVTMPNENTDQRDGLLRQLS